MMDSTEHDHICHYCREEGNIRRNCPKIWNTDTNKMNSTVSTPPPPTNWSAKRNCTNHRKNERRMQGHVGSSTMNNEAGVFIDAEVNGTHTKTVNIYGGIINVSFEKGACYDSARKAT